MAAIKADFRLFPKLILLNMIAAFETAGIKTVPSASCLKTKMDFH
jgi:hypothetical protein